MSLPRMECDRGAASAFRPRGSRQRGPRRRSPRHIPLSYRPLEDRMSPFDRFMRAIVCALCLGFFGASALAQSNSSAMVPAVKAVAAPAFLLAPGTATVALRLDPIDPSLIDSARRANSASVVKRLRIGVGRDVDSGLQAAGESLPWSAVPGGVAARPE